MANAPAFFLRHCTTCGGRHEFCCHSDTAECDRCDEIELNEMLAMFRRDRPANPRTFGEYVAMNCDTRSE